MKSSKSIGTVVVVAAVLTAVMGFGSNHVRKTTVNGSQWYNSFADAQLEAKKTGKPILFLSMFGHLDEDMPCANARTLRATLFKDPEFKKLIGTEVIPAWEMVREVPHITINLGDGKKINRTARGNAVMYLCNPDGKVVDAYPGIYTSKDFLPAIHESIEKLSHADAATVIAYHKERGVIIRPSLTTMSKTIVEGPTLELLGARPASGVPVRITPEDMKNPDRQKFLAAARQIRDYSLTPAPAAETVQLIVGTDQPKLTPAELAQRILDTDSNVNMVRMRPVIHLWFASEKDLPTPAEARDAVLETILKIPYKDPYFGLKDVIMPGTPG